MKEDIINLFTADISGILVQLFFAITVFLMIRDKQKPPIATSLMTGTALIILGLGGSFNNLIVMSLSIFNGFLWLMLAWQRYKQ